jgi:hypothetical protein
VALRLFLWFLIAWASAPLLAESKAGIRVEYAGGTQAALSNGSDLLLDAADPSFLQFFAKGSHTRVPYSKVTTLEYGQKVGRAVVAAVVISPLFLLNKTRKHFFTIGYTDPAGHPQVVVLRVKKGDIRGALASLEARTGLRVEYQNEDARKM